MKIKRKFKIARILVEKIQEFENNNFVDKFYLLYVKKPSCEAVFDFECNDEGYLKMINKIKEFVK